MKIWYVLLILFFPDLLLAQNNLGPRLTAMGNNGSAVYDVWSLHANAAGITATEKPIISLNYIKHLFSGEISTQGLALIIPYKNNFIGIGFQRYGFSEYHESKIDFAYAKKFGDQISAAINLNYHQLKITKYGSATGFSIDVGVLYKLNKHLTFGAYTSNPSKQRYSTTQVAAEIATSYHVGASYNASDKVLIAASISKILNQSVDVGLGIDYKIVELLSLRGGLSAQPFKQYAGFGINYKTFLFDMATAYDPNLGYTPQIAMAYAF